MYPLTTTTCTLTVSSNTRRSSIHHPRFALKKALPTVSLTNANVSCSITTCLLSSPLGLPSAPSNSIPFPTSPIPPPNMRTECEPLQRVLDTFTDGQTCALPGTAIVQEPSSEAWHFDIRRRRSKSCLASSFFHQYSQSPGDVQRDNVVDREVDPLGVHDVGRNEPRRRIHNRAPKVEVKLEGDASGFMTVNICQQKPVRRVKRGKRHVIDVQFLAAMHRSIVWRAKCEAESGTTAAYNIMHRQDILLAEYLWNNLSSRGLKPVLFSTSPPVMSPLAESSLVHTLDDPLSLPLSPPLSSTDSEVNLSHACPPVSVDPPLAPTMPSPISPINKSLSIFTMPQLVAALILRYRDRSSSRPRSPPSTRKKSHSPLYQSTLASYQ